MFEAGRLADGYPLRRVDASKGEATLHSREIRRREARRLLRQYAIFVAQLKAEDTPDSEGAIAEENAPSECAPLSCSRVAMIFAQFARAFHAAHGHYTDIKHIESAYALLHRRIEQVPTRLDRVIIVGLAAAALSSSGLRVHLVVESELALPYLSSMLERVYRQLGLSVGVIETNTPEAARRAAYACDITIIHARECAMDFLRDAVNWPQRGDYVSSKVDQLLGNRARQGSNLMRGLPCAVLLDADSTLIDNARAPIALTRDASPIIEVDALKQALEMVSHLERDRHFVLTGEGAEVELTDLGQRQLAAWSEQLQGVWMIESIAQQMLSIAIVVNCLIRAETHYRIKAKAVEWIIDKRLIPGMAYYSDTVLGRMVAVQQGLELSDQREVAARASYQQIFSRYVHLCGACHSIELIEPELRKIYGLKCSKRWPSIDLKPFQQVSLSENIEQKIEQLKSMLSTRELESVYIVLAYDANLVAGLQGALQDVAPGIAVLDTESITQAATPLKAGGVWLAQSSVLEYLTAMQQMSEQARLTFLVLQRSVRYSEDRRNVFWIQGPPFKNARRVQLLALDDELFSEFPVNRLKNMLGFYGSGRRARKLERRITQIQKNKAQALFTVRKQLLSHDTTMQGLLSFSGRGLYE